MADLPLTLGRNLLSLAYQSDMTERASRIAPISKALGGQATPLGYARWRVTDPDSGPKTFVNEDPAGGAGLVGFANQCVGWYVLLERTGESFRITATDPDTQEITLATWSTSIVEGEIFQLRLSAPGTVFTSYSYRQSVASVLPPPPGIPIMDAEVTALAGSVITVRDGWLNGGPQPVASDGQHVGRTVRLSTLVATDEITDFLAVDGEYWYTVADVSAYQVGDWVRRAADNGATWYGDINTLITPAFPAAMTIVEIDSGANAFRVVSRDGGTTLNRTIFDTAIYGAGYCDLRVYRPVATLATVTASSGSAHTLTLDDVSTFSVSGGPGAVEILIANTSTSGKVPWYVEHPVYVQEAPTGIGVKLKTIDRSEWLGVQNLVPNGVMRVWTTPTSLPDGWLGATSLGAIGSATPSNFVIGQNTDPLYTRVGGKSLFFSTANGVLYVPAIAWTPQYVGQRFSTRPSLILTKWDGNAALITLQLGIMQADGTVLPWYEQPRSVLLQPATATNPRPDPPFRKEPAGTWVDMALQDFDITEPSAYPFNPRPTAGDIANLSAAQGIVACLSFNGGGSTIEGYLDGIAVVTAHEAPADVAEFYDANRLHQDANVQLAEFGPPQFTVGVDFYDAKRMNPTLDEPDAAKGVVALINEASFGISNVRRRITDVVRNMNVPGETRLTIAKRRRRISDAVAKPPATKPPPVTSGGSSGGGTPGGARVPDVSVSIAIDGSLVPTATAVGDSSIVRVKFAWRTDRAPTLAEVQAAASVAVVTGTPTTSTAPFTLAPGQTAYVSVVGYDTAGAESAKADDSYTVDAGAEPGYRRITIDHTKIGATDLTDYPLAVVGTYAFLADTGHGGLLAHVNNVAFYADEAFTVLLDFERVVHDLATGAVEYHVRVPSVSHTVDTTLFMRWDTSATDRSNPTEVWDADFLAVYHMGDGTTVSAQDSTANANHASDSGVDPIAGIVGGAMYTDDPVFAHTILTTPTFGNTVTALTISCLAKPNALGDADGLVFSRASTPPVGLQATYGLSDRTIAYNWRDDVATYAWDSNLTVPNAAWSYLSIAIGPSDAKLQVNGSSATNSVSHASTTLDGPFEIGRDSYDFGNRNFDGALDEVRISTVQRSPSWQIAESNNLRDPSTFYAIDAPLAPSPTLTYVRDGGDVVVTVSAPGADSVKIAADLAGVPTDSDVRAEDAITTLPLRATFPAPGDGETLHVKAFAYTGVDESAPLTVDIPFSAGDEGPTAPSGAEFVVTAADPSIPNARVLSDSATVTVDLSSDGEVKLDVVGGGTPALDDLTDVDAPSPADGDVLTYDSGSGDWVAAAPSGGGGGSGSGRWDPMALRSGQSASALDDDWSDTGTTLNARWTPSANWPPTAFDIDTTFEKHLSIQSASAGSVALIRSILQAIPAGDFAIQTLVAVNANYQNLSAAGLVICDGTGGSANTNVLNNYQDGTSRTGLQGGTMSNINANVLAPFPSGLNPVVLRIERASGVYTAEWSPDGINGQRYTFSLQSGMTPTHFGIGALPYAGEIRCAFGTFRYSATPTTRWGAYR